jgi:hypothetical protein
MVKDIFVDTNVIAKYPKNGDKHLVTFFRWLHARGILVVSTFLLKEYSGIGSSDVAVLLDYLRTQSRLKKFKPSDIDKVKDSSFSYTCNRKDWSHVKLVMLSQRRLAVAGDVNFVNDVNRFPRYKAIAVLCPSKCSYV